MVAAHCIRSSLHSSLFDYGAYIRRMFWTSDGLSRVRSTQTIKRPLSNAKNSLSTRKWALNIALSPSYNMRIAFSRSCRTLRIFYMALSSLYNIRIRLIKVVSPTSHRTFQIAAFICFTWSGAFCIISSHLYNIFASLMNSYRTFRIAAATTWTAKSPPL